MVGRRCDVVKCSDPDKAENKRAGDFNSSDWWTVISNFINSYPLHSDSSLTRIVPTVDRYNVDLDQNCFQFCQMANEQDRDGLGDAEHPQDDSQEYISSRRFHIEKANARRAALITLLIIMCLQNLAVRLMNLPLYRVIEMRYCQQYYQTQDPDVIGGDGNIDEKLCKIDAIQVKLAWLQGAIETIHVVCGEWIIR